MEIQTSQCQQGLAFVTSDTNSIVLWNKYKLTIYNNIDAIFNSTKPYIVNPQFAIEKVLLHKNNILCLDCSGHVNITTIPNPEFNISKDKVMACEIMENEYVICLEIQENVTHLTINEFNETFSSKQEFTFSNPDDSTWKTAPRAKNIISVHNIQGKDLNKQIRLTFDVKESSDLYLAVICLDKINIYALMIPKTQSSNLKIVKLYRSQSQIVGIHISTEKEICIVVGLSSGNIVKVPFSNDEPKVIHLNTALHKFVVIKNMIIYTDGLTMWKIGDIFSNSDLKREQFIVKNVRDFCVVRHKLVCTTFSNLIYSFHINDKRCYVTLKDECEEPMTDSNLEKIVAVTRENEELVEKINKEREYLLALSLSNRQTIMDSLIKITSDVFENYNDVERQIKELTLTETRNEYNDTQSYYFVIKISVTPIQHKLNKLLSGMLGDIKIHITLFADKVLKTTSIQIDNQLRNKNFVIPLKRSELTDIEEMQVIVKIVTNIPGQMDGKQRQWTTLYSKSIEVNTVNFRKTINHTTSTCLKEDDIPLETIIYDIARHLHGTHYKFELSDRQDI